MNKIPIIIDTDPGTDDAIAIMMILMSDNFDVKALTTVGGNVTLDRTSQNAKNIVAFCGLDIPVAVGAEKPLVSKAIYAPHIHGNTGMGTVTLPVSDKPYSNQGACDMIYRTALEYGGTLRLLTLGAVTNIAMTIQKYPDLKKYIDRIICMGGSFGPGNRTPVAEFNIYADPEAAKIVFDSGIPITMVGLNVTHETVVTKDDNKRIQSIENKIAKVVGELIEFTYEMEQKYNDKGAVMHDPLAAAVMIDPSIVETKSYYVDVELDGRLTRGMTVVDVYDKTGHKANVDVAIKVDNQKFLDLLVGLMEKA